MISNAREDSVQSRSRMFIFNHAVNADFEMGLWWGGGYFLGLVFSRAEPFAAWVATYLCDLWLRTMHRLGIVIICFPAEASFCL